MGKGKWESPTVCGVCCLILNLFHLYFHAQQIINLARAILSRKRHFYGREFHSSVNGTGKFGVENLTCIFGTLGT